MMQDVVRLFKTLQHVIRPARATTNAVESGVIQRLQVKFNTHETRDLNSMQHYGFASSLKAGCDVMIINVAGDNSNGDVIASNDQRHRPKGLSAGAVRVYNDAGSYVHIEGGNITIVASSAVTMNTPKLIVNGDIEATGDVKAGDITLRTHKHLGVTSGVSKTGLPTT
jgi:phage gp45-like